MQRTGVEYKVSFWGYPTVLNLAFYLKIEILLFTGDSGNHLLPYLNTEMP